MGRAGVEPDIQDVVDLLIVGRVAAHAQELGRLAREPGVGAVLTNGLDDAGVDSLVAERMTGVLVDEHGQGRAPCSLARDQPVRPRLDHPADAVAAGRGVERRRVDGGEGPLAQGHAVVQRLVHGNEPLRRIAEDHRRLGPPGMRIGVLDPSSRQQRPGLDQLVDDGVVGRSEPAGLLALRLQHLQPREQRDMRVVGAVRVDHLGHLAMAVGDPHLVVLCAVTGRRVHEPRARILGHMVAIQQRNREVIVGIQPRERMFGHQTRDMHVAKPPPGRDVSGLADLIGQHVGDDQLVAGFRPGLKLKIGFDGLDLVGAIADLGSVGDRAIAGDGPWRRGPDDDRGAFQVDPLRIEAARIRPLAERELHPDRRTDVVVILDLGFGQGGPLNRRPHHRLGAAVELA